MLAILDGLAIRRERLDFLPPLERIEERLVLQEIPEVLAEEAELMQALQSCNRVVRAAKHRVGERSAGVHPYFPAAVASDLQVGGGKLFPQESLRSFAL